MEQNVTNIFEKFQRIRFSEKMSNETVKSLELEEVRQAMRTLQDKVDQQHVELMEATLQIAESTSYPSSLPFKVCALSLPTFGNTSYRLGAN